MKKLKMGDVLHFRKTDERDGTFKPVWTLNGKDVDAADPILKETPFDFYRMLVAKGDVADYATPYEILPPPDDIPGWDRDDDEIAFTLGPAAQIAK